MSNPDATAPSIPEINYFQPMPNDPKYGDPVYKLSSTVVLEVIIGLLMLKEKPECNVDRIAAIISDFLQQRDSQH